MSLFNKHPEGTGANGEGEFPQVGFTKLSQPQVSAGPGSSLGPTITPVFQDPSKKRRRPREKKLNIQEIIKMLYRGRWLILGTFLLVFAYTVYSTYSKPFIYASGTRMFIEKLPVTATLRPLPTDDDHSVANIIQFFKSHVVGKHVAQLIHKYAQGDRQEIDSLYTKYFGNAAAVPPDPKQLSIIKMVDNPKLTPAEGLANEQVIEARATAAVNIIPDPSNDYLNVSAEAYTPLDASFIVNTYVVTFATDHLARARSNAAELKEFLNQQKQRSYDTLYQVESKLKHYLSETNGLSIEARATELSTQLDQTRLKLANLLIDIDQQKKTYSDLVSNLDTVEKNYFANLTLDPYINLLQAQLASAQVELEQMAATNSAMDPRTKKYLKDVVKTTEEKIATLNEKLKEKAQESLHSKVIVVTNSDGNNVGTMGTSTMDAITQLKQTILSLKLKIGQNELVASRMQDLIGKLESELYAMPEKIIQAAQLKRAQGSAEKLYSALEDKYMDAWLSERSVFGSVKLEDPAVPNASPIRPNRQSSIFTGSLIGLAIGIGLVIMLSFLDSTIRSPDELEAQSLHVLATIPIITIPQDEKLKAELPAGGLMQPKFTSHRITHLDPRSTVAEAYRSLRTTIQYAGLDHPIQTLAVTSSAPQEGKSTTSANIAITMAQLGKKTLLVDTDLRRPVVNSIFGLEREPGLTNVLFNKISLEEAVQTTDVPNLYILPCGVIPPNPAELLGSTRMKSLIEEMKQVFDIIIFDTPPVIAVTDAVLLGMNLDATLLIARSDITKMDALLRGVEAIERTGTRMLGVVLNNFNVANAYGAYYRYYQYYHYYSMDKAPKQGMLGKLMSPGKRIFKKDVS